MVITLPNKGNLQQGQTYRTISLISHPYKVMLKIVLNRLKPQTKKIISEEQAGFRAGRSTTEQTINLRILCEKYLQHQKTSTMSSQTSRGLRQGLTCIFVGNQEVQHQRQPYPSHQTPLRQGDQCSPLQRQNRRLVPNNSWSPTGMPTLTHPFRHISENDLDRCLRRSRKALSASETEQSPISA